MQKKMNLLSLPPATSLLQIRIEPPLVFLGVEEREPNPVRLGVCVRVWTAPPLLREGEPNCRSVVGRSCEGVEEERDEVLLALNEGPTNALVESALGAFLGSLLLFVLVFRWFSSIFSKNTSCSTVWD